MFEKNHIYTRDEMEDRLMCSKEGYLRHCNGRIVSACLRLADNFDAPLIILPGIGPLVKPYGRDLCNQLEGQPRGIPIFIIDANNPNLLECKGYFTVERWSEDPEIMEFHAIRSNRIGHDNGVSRVIFMREIEHPEDLE